MSLLLKKLNIDKNRNEREALNFSFVIAICWHICLFSIFFIKLPNNIGRNANINSLNFIGSFLKKYDFGSSENNPKSAQAIKYFNLVKQNVSALDVKDYARLDDLLEKPGNSSFVNTEVPGYVLSFGGPQLKLNPLNRDPSSADNDFFDVKNLPNTQIYFKEGLPGLVKFDLYISERGRVAFLKKATSSGSFDADMAVQRALIRTVFDTYHFGVIHRRILELDLKQ